MIRVSTGTAGVLGLKRVETRALPTTGYLMNSGGCSMQCAFCPQGTSTNDSRLSRITWPEYSIDRLIEGLQGDHGLKRLCLQTVHNSNWLSDISQLMKELADSSLPVCISCRPKDINEVRQLYSLGVDTLSIPLDACTVEVADQINRPWHNLYELLIETAKEFPGRVNTHLIIGLGETEREAIELMQKLAREMVNIALFAFTPVRGTKLESYPPPPIGHYRRVQAARYMLEHNSQEEFVYDCQERVLFTDRQLAALKPVAFETSGCPDCNRPYYNERPGQTMYNYPWSLNTSEWEQAKKELQVSANE